MGGSVLHWMSAVAEGGGLNLEADMGERLGRPWGSVED